MRLAITAAEKADGKWDVLATPEIPIQVQKDLRKELIVSQGKKGSKQYQRLVLLSTTGEVKRSKFKVSKKAKKEIEAAE